MLLTDEDLCTAGVALPEPGRFADGGCGRPAVVVVEYGCVHEHVGTESLCGGHRDLLLSGRTACARCWEGPPVSRHTPHPCAQLGRVVTELAGLKLPVNSQLSLELEFGPGVASGVSVR
jgi:hypothetical protein